jgi:hypothetical protein
MSSRPPFRSLIAVAAGCVVLTAAACGRRAPKAEAGANAAADLTLAPHGSVSPNFAIAPDEIFATRAGHKTATVRHRMLVHETGGADLAAATSTSATPAPAAPAVVAVAAAPAPAAAAAPRAGHIAVVGEVAGTDASRPDPSLEPSMNGPYRGDMGAGFGAGDGPIIRGGSVGDDDHCERRPGFGGGGRGGMNPVFFAVGPSPRSS